MSNNGNVRTISSGGVGFFSILTIVFIVLKLVGVISWSWFIVFLPLIIGAILSILFFLIFAVFIKWMINQFNN